MDDILSLWPKFSFDSYMILEFQAMCTCWPNVQWFRRLTSGHNLVFLRLLLSISRKLVAKVVLVPCVCVLYLSDQFLAQLKVDEYAVNEYYSAVQFCCSANFIW